MDWDCGANSIVTVLVVCKATFTFSHKRPFTLRACPRGVNVVTAFNEFNYSGHARIVWTALKL